jgi:hypothetical protein
MEKKGKIKRKNFIFFCLCAFTWEEEMSLIKKACFMLNFLNLKSFPSYLFFVVASSLSILCEGQKIWKVLKENLEEKPTAVMKKKCKSSNFKEEGRGHSGKS